MMKTETLTSKDDIEKELTYSLSRGCRVKVNKKCLRVNFIDDENSICKSVRLESMKNLSKEFKDRLPISKYIEFTNRKNGKIEIIDIDRVRCLSIIPQRGLSRNYGLNVCILKRGRR